jgi:hypothetical protein
VHAVDGAAGKVFVFVQKDDGVGVRLGGGDGGEREVGDHVFVEFLSLRKDVFLRWVCLSKRIKQACSIHQVKIKKRIKKRRRETKWHRV